MQDVDLDSKFHYVIKHKEITKFCDTLIENLMRGLKLKLYDDTGKDVTEEYPNIHIPVEMVWLHVVSKIIVPLVRFLTGNEEWKYGE